MNIKPSTTALVPIEIQKDFTTEGGAFHDAVKKLMGETGMLSKTQQLVSSARERGVAFMHVPITTTKVYNEITDHPYGILAGVV